MEYEEKDVWRFIELMIRRVSRGYLLYYSFIQRKPEKDEDIARYYHADITRFTRVRQREKGFCSTLYTRYKNLGIVFIRPNLRLFPELEAVNSLIKDFRREPLILKIGNILSLKIKAVETKEGVKTEVTMTKDTYRTIKENLSQIVRQHANPKNQKQAQTALMRTWNILNGIPAYRGILQQKRELRRWVAREARRRGINIKQKDLRITYVRKNRLKIAS